MDEFNIEECKKKLKDYDLVYINELKNLVRERLALEENRDSVSVEENIKEKIELARNLIELFDNLSSNQ